MNFLRLSALLALVLLPGIQTSHAGEAASIDVHRAIEIANAALKADTENWSGVELVTVKRFSTPLNDHFRREPSDPENRKVYAKLKNRTYWWVYYITPSAEFGGDVGVFVDAKTGAVIDIYRGK